MLLTLPNSLNVVRHNCFGLFKSCFIPTNALHSSQACSSRLAPFLQDYLAIPAPPIMASERPSKRARLGDGDHADPDLIRRQRAAFLSSMSRDISPPPSARATPDVEVVATNKDPSPDSLTSKPPQLAVPNPAPQGTRGPPIKIDKPFPKRPGESDDATRRQRLLPSQFALTKIRDLPSSSNLDTVSLHDILGNPLIKEAWIFNFCFDIDWMMQFFDSDVRDLVQVKIIHGSWRNGDRNKIGIDDACRRWPNVEAFKAYLPDQFGTHHSKMFVLFTHDNQAEVVIHTANMLMKDWTNMTQSVWRTGPLSKLTGKDSQVGIIGSGSRFKHDLLAYLKEYKKPTQALHKHLQEYNFNHVRGALVASVPSKFDNSVTKSNKEQHLWGYPQLREVLSHVNRTRPLATHGVSEAKPHLVAQVSSIATLPNNWLQNLVASANPLNISHSPLSSLKPTSPTLSIIYPTPSNVAESLDGYAAGGSIHTKAQSATHITQIDNLRPHLCQWTEGPLQQFQAKREKAAPHIKTYVQYNQRLTREALEKGAVEVEWALLTSANLSVQAWGSLPRAEGKGKAAKKGNAPSGALQEGMVHIQSFEIGVLVWPGLFIDEFDDGSEDVGVSSEDRKGNGKIDTRGRKRARMVPIFGKNIPGSEPAHVSNPTAKHAHMDEATGIECEEVKDTAEIKEEKQETLTIGLRIPYDLPLTPYKPGEMPWSPQGNYVVPDSRGGEWKGS